MTVQEVQKWFGNLHKACLALEIAAQNMTRWKTQGYIPWKQQFKIAVITEGALMPDDEDPYLVRFPKKPKIQNNSRTNNDETNNTSTISPDAHSM